MNARVEKLTAAIADAKALIRALKADKNTLKAEFKEELKAAKAGAKSATKKATKPAKKVVVKKVVAKKAASVKVTAKKVAVVKKAKTPSLKKVAPAPEVIQEPLLEEIVSNDDSFPFGE